MASKAQRQKNQALHRENNKKERIAQLNAEKLQLTRDILSEWEIETHSLTVFRESVRVSLLANLSLSKRA